MEIFLIAVHIVASIVLVVAILLQSGKGGGMGSGFGGAAAAGQQIFGGRGAASFLGKATVAIAATFMATSLGLAYISSQPRSALDLTQAPGTTSQGQVDDVIESGSGPAPNAPSDAAPVPVEESEPLLLNLDSLDDQPGDEAVDEAVDEAGD
ncbi:MAG: preprotein translocase subunit SecG [Bradymonadaceae bacterium]|nr:preprotein translocase subunit SecG [Lujinxingiaceae bacterium]